MIKGEVKEVLSELINISFGSATAAIASLFDNFATLHIPGIKVVPVEQVEPFIMDKNESSPIYITTQHFKGNFEGEIIFVIETESARNMQSLICEVEGIDNEDASGDSETRQIVLEISNILGSSCIGKLVELLESEVAFAPPVIEYSGQLLIGLDKTQYKKIIIISTVLEFEEIKISGNLFIMFNNEMFLWLEKSLEAFLEDNT
jgi:chemotaxis protein CheC